MFPIVSVKPQLDDFYLAKPVVQLKLISQTILVGNFLLTFAPWETKVRRYNWHSVGSLGWPFPMLKY